MESYRTILKTSSEKISQACVTMLEQHGVLAITSYSSDLLQTKPAEISIMVSDHNFQRAQQLIGIWNNAALL